MIWLVLIATSVSVAFVQGKIPKILKDADDYQGFISGFSKFNVETNKVPDSKFYWHHNGIKITQTYKPTFFKMFDEQLRVNSPATKEYAGTYQFFMESPVGTIAGRKVTVEFAYVGKFDNDPSKTEDVRDVVLGQATSLSCPKHTPGRNYIYKWGTPSSAEGAKFVNSDPAYIVLDDGTLFFSHLSNTTFRYMNGKSFRCGMEVNDGKSSNLFTWAGLATRLKATEQNFTKFGPRIVVSLPNKTFYEGESIFMKCVAAGNPIPTYSWKKIDDDGNERDIKFDNNDGIDFEEFNRILIIKPATRKHAGGYRCTAVAAGNSDSVEGRLIFEVKPSWVGKERIQSVTPSIFSSHTWLCNATGYPQPTYKWYVNGTELKESADHRINGGRITFPELKKEQSGMYECVAANRLDNIYQTAYLDVQAEKPVFESNTGTETLFLDNDGLIKCHAPAAPKAKNTWTKNGVKIDLSLSKYELVNRENLLIKKVAKNDAGSYKCTASNLYGMDVKNIAVKVVGEIKFEEEPKDVNLTRGTRTQLKCKAKGDQGDKQQLKYKWLFNGHELKKDEDVVWSLSNHALYFIKAEVKDSGIYECVAYIEVPSYAEKRRSARVIVRGPPQAPNAVEIRGDCSGFSAKLSWSVAGKNYDPIQYFIIQWSTSYNSDMWHNFTQRVAANLFEKEVRPLSPYTKYRFRVLAINNIGTSEPSGHTSMDKCLTPSAAPTKCPPVRGEPGKPDELTIKWKKMALIDQNGPDFKYNVQYRRKDDTKWAEETLNASKSEFMIPSSGYYQFWEFRIRGVNQNDSGPFCDGKSFSGQNAPAEAPGNFRPKGWGSDYVVLEWTPINPGDTGSVDGYKLSYWQESIQKTKTGRSTTDKECVKDDPCEVEIPGGKTNTARLDKLIAYRAYSISLRGYNSGGDGPPASTRVDTTKSVPGAPIGAKAIPYARFIKLKWKEPEVPNGIILGYEVSIFDKSTWRSVRIGGADRSYMFGGLRPNSRYKLKVRAENKAGFGSDTSPIPVSTKTLSVPAKPAAPLAEGTGKDAVNITFQEGTPAKGFPLKFLVRYRQKGQGDEDLVSTSLQSLFGNDSRPFVVVEGLDTETEYEFATVASNDVGSSERSNFSIAIPGKARPPKAQSDPVYKKSWFVVIVVIVCLLLLILFIALLITRKRGERYPVGKREKKRAGILDDAEEVDSEHYPMKPPRQNGNGMKRHNSGSTLPNRDQDRDSLDEYGEDRFGEDAGSLIGEYNEDKKPSGVEGPEFV